MAGVDLSRKKTRAVADKVMKLIEKEFGSTDNRVKDVIVRELIHMNVTDDLVERIQHP